MSIRCQKTLYQYVSMSICQKATFQLRYQNESCSKCHQEKVMKKFEREQRYKFAFFCWWDFRWVSVGFRRTRWDSVGFSEDSVGFSGIFVGLSGMFAFLLFCVGMWGHLWSPVPWRQGRWSRGIRAKGPKPTTSVRQEQIAI